MSIEQLMERKQIKTASRLRVLAIRKEDVVGTSGPIERPRLRGGSYFSEPKRPECFSSGCAILDLALGGGFVEGRMINVVGDSSTGKSLNCIEAAANFAAKYKTGHIRYRETESAFDIPYAQQVGFPLDRADFGGAIACDTVEDFERDVDDFLKHLPKGEPGLYILDSMDALSDEAEMDRPLDSDKGSYGMQKAKFLSRFFRKLVRRLEAARVTLIIVSQVRANIGVTFGESHVRSGGKALDFYASQIVWLAFLGKVFKTRKGVERAVGIRVRAKLKKNKVGRPFREAEYPILFDFGVDDATASAEWLNEVKRLDALGLDNAPELEDEEPKKGRFGKPKAKKSSALAKYLREIEGMNSQEYAAERKRLGTIVRKTWYEVESDFNPGRRKYV